ncbi:MULTISPECIES: LacI family DNA-binding transcriptional regulator [unclassified Streptomyces]|nr:MULTISPECIES: LacI family DNA-binding transcriptional regulator [unclassified Streptomyces]
MSSSGSRRRPPTISDVAQAASVSRTTVSHALRDRRRARRGRRGGRAAA